MKLTHANTQLGITFKVVEFQDVDVLEMVKDATKLARITDCANADRRQKVALVDARFDLAQLIGTGTEPDGTPIEGVTGTLGFKREVKNFTKNNETVYAWGETENDFINRFVDAIADGSFTVEGYNPATGDAKVKDTHARKFLQSLADTCGDQKFTGLAENPAGPEHPLLTVTDVATYILDITKTERKSAGPGIPKWALETADLIITKGLAEQSRAKHLAGYTNSNGIAIDPIVCGELQVAHPHHTPEEKEAVHQANRKTVAKWCAEARRQENEKRQKDAVADFA